MAPHALRVTLRKDFPSKYFLISEPSDDTLSESFSSARYFTPGALMAVTFLRIESTQLSEESCACREEASIKNKKIKLKIVRKGGKFAMTDRSFSF